MAIYIVLTGDLQDNQSDGHSATATNGRTQTEMETSNDLRVIPVAFRTSTLTTSPTSDVLSSPKDHGGLENSTGSLRSNFTVSSPQTIPETRPVNHATSPPLSPAIEITNPRSRDSSVRSLRMSTNSWPRRIPNSGSARPRSRRTISGNHSASPAQEFMSRWSGYAAAPEPKPDDEGQAFGDTNQYIIGHLVNTGGFGVVREAHTISPAGEPIVRAVKIVRKAIPEINELENERVQQELEHEISVWRHLKHRHILRMHAAFNYEFATFCLMDLNKGGTLFELVERSRASAAHNDGRRGLPPKLAKNYAYQLACALRYLHEDIRVCHRDVKLENCLIDMSVPNAETEGGNLRLCDFGLADFLQSETIDELSAERYESPRNGVRAARNRTTSSVIGTLEYASPRGLSVNRKLFETAGDVWAFGVIVYALCTGNLPFRGRNASTILGLILQAEWDGTTLVNAAAGGGEVRELVQGCLEMDIDIRLTIGETLRSEWFEGCEEALGEEDTNNSIW